jgi:hypothetical protein
MEVQHHVFSVVGVTEMNNPFSATISFNRRVSVCDVTALNVVGRWGGGGVLVLSCRLFNDAFTTSKAL